MNPAGTASARTVQVRGKPEVFHYPGLYRIEPVQSGEALVNGTGLDVLGEAFEIGC